MDRRYLVKDRTIEVIDNGRSGGAKGLDAKQAARIDELAASVAGARVEAADSLASDDMETKLDIRRDDGSSSLQLRTGDSAPPEVWDLIGEVSRAFGD